MANRSKGSHPKPVADEWCNTYSKFFKFNYQWTIHDFSSRRDENGKKIESSEFYIGPNKNSTWCLKMYPNGEDKQSEGHVSLYLYLIKWNEKESNVNPKRLSNVKFSILNAKQEKKNIVVIDKTDCPDENLGIGCKKFIERAVLLDETKCFLPDDKLTIFYDGAIECDSVNEHGHKDPKQIIIAECKLSKGFENLFLQPKFSDVTLVDSGTEIKAHKAILAAQSAVLADKFEKELKENTISIGNIREDVLKEMLYFIYTGEARNLEEEKNCKDLLFAADKYGLERLKNKCEEQLFKQLSVDTAVDTLVTAHENNCDQLKELTFVYIKDHIAEVSRKEEWQKAIEANSKSSELFAEIIKRIASEPDEKRENKQKKYEKPQKSFAFNQQSISPMP